MMKSHFKSLLLVLTLALTAVSAHAVKVTIPEAPAQVKAGASIEVTAVYEGAAPGGIVQIQLLDTKNGWKQVASEWKNIAGGDGEHTFTIKVKADVTPGPGFLWQGLLYDKDWKKQGEITYSKITMLDAGAADVPQDTKPAEANPVKDVKPEVKKPPASVETLGSAAAQALAKKNINAQPAPEGSDEWQPEGDWTIEWTDEFNGEAGDENNPNVTKWYPMLGWTPEDFKNKDHKGLRWNGKTPESSQFYSTKTGNHWLDGNGNLLMRAIADKSDSPNDNGVRVKTAYLQTGFPADWNGIGDSKVRWDAGDGVFVSPTVDGEIQPLYISARLRADEMKGYSTWFAFWMFSQTRSYNNNPADGTEIDLLEIVGGKSAHFNNMFNVANHWYPKGGVSEDEYFNEHTNPKGSQFANITDGNYHTWGLEWTDKYMKCYVDGKLFYTFTENIPTEPIDMMLMLTLEYQKNLWHGDSGDGRTEGPFVTDTPELREMSRVLVDYVRVYRKQNGSTKPTASQDPPEPE